ncbi:MAG: ATPase, T2SS/T4P/T4SS family, partial [bacterium]|nr:ATPase, T2SS/T4P/T4SS family [bacterium]
MTNDDNKPNIASEEKSEALSRKLKDMGRQRTEAETLVTARDEGLDYIELSKYPITQSALSILSREEAEKARAICFVRSAEGVSVATVDPTADVFLSLVKDLKARFKQPVFVSLISEPTFQEVFKQYEALPAYTPPPPGVEIGAESIGKFRDAVKDFRGLDEKLQGVSTTDMVAFILAAALDSRASDVHLEPTEADAKVRFRIDGVLYTTASLTLDNFQKIVTRIKLASHLKINVLDVPQDGHFVITVPEDSIDVRVSTVPSASGESIAMRVLRSSAAGLKLEDLGLRGVAYDTVLREVDRPTGMVISCGPTGSGKTTLLYAMLQRRNNSETKIITMEDPIEYRIEGLTQTQVSPDEGYTFAKGLKAALRQDPDVIMVGEIRDLET